ncbi:MAG: hypothetical protein ACXW2E_00435 [Nitrososphaeraceae archaeon]
MQFLKELFQINENLKKKNKKKDKTADKFMTHVGGNMLMRSVCSGDLSGTKK